MEVLHNFIGYALPVFGLLAAIASLYRFARSKKTLQDISGTARLADENVVEAVIKKVLLIKKLEFYSLMLLVFATLLFYYLIQGMPSAVMTEFTAISIKILQIYGVFALLMLPLRWWTKQKIRKLCLTQSSQCAESLSLLVHYIEHKENLSLFWRNQVIKFIQNKFF